MPEGMGLGMGNPSPWDRSRGWANNNFSGTMSLPGLGGLKQPGMAMQNAMAPKLAPQPLANAQGIQQALGKVAAALPEGPGDRGRMHEQAVLGDPGASGGHSGALQSIITGNYGAKMARDRVLTTRSDPAGMSHVTQVHGDVEPGPEKRAGTRPPAAPGEFRPTGSRREGSSAPFFTEGHGMDAIDTLLHKLASQDNNAPQRSETGGSSGLSYNHKEDDYAQGQAAWAATGKYFRGGKKLKEEPNPFEGKHRGKQASGPLDMLFSAPAPSRGLLLPSGSKPPATKPKVAAKPASPMDTPANFGRPARLQPMINTMTAPPKPSQGLLKGAGLNPTLFAPGKTPILGLLRRLSKVWQGPQRHAVAESIKSQRSSPMIQDLHGSIHNTNNSMRGILGIEPGGHLPKQFRTTMLGGPGATGEPFNVSHEELMRMTKGGSDSLDEFIKLSAGMGGMGGFRPRSPMGGGMNMGGMPKPNFSSNPSTFRMQELGAQNDLRMAKSNNQAMQGVGRNWGGFGGGIRPSNYRGGMQQPQQQVGQTQHFGQGQQAAQAQSGAQANAYNAYRTPGNPLNTPTRPDVQTNQFNQGGITQMDPMSVMSQDQQSRYQQLRTPEGQRAYRTMVMKQNPAWQQYVGSARKEIGSAAQGGQGGQVTGAMMGTPQPPAPQVAQAQAPQYDTSGFTENARNFFSQKSPAEQAKAWQFAQANKGNAGIWAKQSASMILPPAAQALEALRNRRRAKQQQKQDMGNELTMMDKTAFTAEKGGLPSRLLASTVGQVGSAATLMNPMISMRTFVNPKTREHSELGENLAAAEPDTLNDTKLRLGGTDVVDDLLWKREEEDKPLPWHKQIGGRMMHNPRTTVLGKAMGLLGYPINWAQGNLFRGSHYNPSTDAAHIYADEPAITQHELGHAMDFNYPISKKKGIGGTLGRYGKALGRDIYTAARAIPGMDIYQEAQANTKSRKAMKKFTSPDDMLDVDARRAEVLYPGMGSYIGGTIGKFAPPLMIPATLAGTLGGKAVGAVRAAGLEGQSEERRKDKKKHEEKHEEKASADITPFARGFIGHCMQLGMSYGQIKQAAFDVSCRFGKEASDELLDGLEKTAGIFDKAIGLGQKAMPFAKNLWQGMRGGANAINPGTVANEMGMGQKVMQGAKNFGKSVIGEPANAIRGQGFVMQNAAGAPGVVPQQAGRLKSFLSPGGGRVDTAMRMAGGAMTGSDMGEVDQEGVWDNLLGAAGGAAYGRYMPRMGAAGQAAGRRAFTGSFAGSLGDQLSGYAGMDTGGRLGQAGAWAGFGSAAMPKFAPGNLGKFGQRMGGVVDDLVTKPWQHMGPKGMAQQVFGRNTPLAQRAGAVLGPGAAAYAPLASAGAGLAVAGKNMAGNWIGDQAAQGVEAKIKDPKFQNQMAMELTGMPADQLKAKVAQLSKMGDFGGLSSLGSMFDPVIDMIMGQGAGAKMGAMQKLMLVLGGGAMLGGAMGGSGTVAGLGGLALAGGLMGGNMPGMGGFFGGQQPQQAGAAPGQAPGAAAQAPTQMSAQDELAKQVNSQRQAESARNSSIGFHGGHPDPSGLMA